MKPSELLKLAIELEQVDKAVKSLKHPIFIKLDSRGVYSLDGCYFNSVCEEQTTLAALNWVLEAMKREGAIK
jgi:hypothetical protein